MALTKGKVAVAGATATGGVAAITTTVVVVNNAAEAERIAKEENRAPYTVTFKANTNEGASENGISNIKEGDTVTLVSLRSKKYWNERADQMWEQKATEVWDKLIKDNSAAKNWAHNKGRYLKKMCSLFKDMQSTGYCLKEDQTSEN